MTAALEAVPRVPLARGAPTPLHAAPGLSEALGLEVWLKRDDLLGFGLGGNKVRQLEYLLADAELRGCDCLVTGAGTQSNWAMLAATAAAVRGLDAHLVYYGQAVPPAGNHLLALQVGATITFTGDADRATVDTGIADRAAKLAAEGRRPYPLPRGGATALGAVGYVRGARELAEQCATVGLRAGDLWLATGSCGTQAGLVAGLGRSGPRVVGVTVSRPVAECRAEVRRLATGAAEVVGLAAPDAAVVEVRGGHLGRYGARSASGDSAAALVARTEGVLLDPVFGAKAMGALAAAARAGTVSGPVVFLVSGGAPTLFTTPARAAQ